MWQSVQRVLKRLVDKPPHPKIPSMAEVLGTAVVAALASIVAISAQAFQAAFHPDGIVVLITQVGISLLMILLLACVVVLMMIVYWLWLLFRLHYALLNQRRRKMQAAPREAARQKPPDPGVTGETQQPSS